MILRRSKDRSASIRYRDLAFFLRFLAPVRKLGILVFLLTLLSTILSTLLPLSSKLLLDVFIMQKGPEIVTDFLKDIGLPALIPAAHYMLGSLGLLMACMLILGLSAEIFKALQHWLLIRLSQRVALDMQISLFERVLRLPLSFLQEQAVGALFSRVFSDMQWLHNYLIHSDFTELISGGFFLLFSIGVLLWLNPVLALTVLAAIPLWIGITGFFGMRLRLAGTRILERETAVTQDIQEILSGMEVVKAFLSERQEASKVSVKLVTLFQTKQHMMVLTLLANHLKKSSKLVIVLLIMWLGIREIERGAMSVGDITAFMVYLAYFSSISNKLSGLYLSFQAVLSALIRVRELFRVVPEYDDEDNVRGLMPERLEGDIRFENVVFGYEENRPVLDMLSFSIRAGECAAFVGASGSGKTTLISLLIKFNTPQSGVIAVDGQNVRELDTRWLREQIGFVSQDIFLFNESVEYNIAYGTTSATPEDVVQAAKAAHIHQEIEALPHGYRTIVGERGVKFSVGQRQRISIARAFLKNPKILIFDEPTSALDAETENRLKISLNALSQDRTVLIITHQMSFTDIANRVFELKDGTIQEIARHDV